jgi:GNAT superfamily N-acetyltransferase
VAKNCWLRNHFGKGVRAKVSLTPDGRQCGYIEYIPGEHAWRAVQAEGYLFIHCVWTFFKQYQGMGAARRLVEGCVEEARREDRRGVAVLARSGPWLAKPDLFLKCGFQPVAAAPPDYQLLALKFEASAPDPSFPADWDKRLKRYVRGFTIIRSAQCPHIAKFADEIAASAEEEFGLKPRVVELKTARDAQRAPTPYAVFALIKDGRLLADHQISRTRFRNIMRKAAG